MDNLVYCKKVSPSGAIKYVPFGEKIGEHYLPDGIWYIHHTEHSTGTTNVDKYLVKAMKLGDPEFPNLPEICGINSCVDYILNNPEFAENFKGGWTWNELIHKVVDLTIKYSKQNVQKENK